MKKTSSATRLFFLFLAGTSISCNYTVRHSTDPAYPPAEDRVHEKSAEEKKDFSSLEKNMTSSYLEMYPEVSTMLKAGPDPDEKEYNGRLSGYGPAGVISARALNIRFSGMLDTVDHTALEGQDAISFAALRHAVDLATRRNEFDYGYGAVWNYSPPYALTQLDGIHIDLPRLLLTQQPMETPADLDAYLERLEKLPEAINETIRKLEEDSKKSVIAPSFALEGARRSVREFISSTYSQNPLYQYFMEKVENMENLSGIKRRQYRERAKAIMNMNLYPAYRRLDSTLNRLIFLTDGIAGVWRLPDGEAFYQYALDVYGAGGMTAEEIHRTGLEEVSRITSRMDEILKTQGYTQGSVAERFALLGKERKNRYENTASGRKAVLHDLDSQIAAVMERISGWFPVIPEQNIEVRRIPVYEQDTAPGGYYTPPPVDGTRPGIYWINLKNTADWPRHTLPTLTYHEAVPGHHFQISLQLSDHDIPLSRNIIRFSEYSEGWALYAEKLAFEMGMYESDPDGNLGRLQSELFRAARLVTDTGIHHMRWTRQEAIEYMQNITGDTTDSVTREIERYAVWPGQACSYKLGMIAIERMRTKAEKALGPDFDIKSFHNRILKTGAVPLPVLENGIDTWIADITDKRKQAQRSPLPYRLSGKEPGGTIHQ